MIVGKDHDIAGPGGRGEDLHDIDAEDLAIHRSIDDGRGGRRARGCALDRGRAPARGSPCSNGHTVDPQRLLDTLAMLLREAVLSQGRALFPSLRGDDVSKRDAVRQRARSPFPT